MTVSQHPENADTHDAWLGDLFTSLADRLQRGQQVDIENTCRLHPQHASELRQLWATMLVAQAAGADIRESARTKPGGEENLHGQWPGMPTLPARFGDYELIEQIGHGGMGIVFRAIQVGLNREVAVKMIRRDRLPSNRQRQRFFAEAQATARLEHPAIVSVYEVGQFDDHPFFSMQFVCGETLADRLRRGPIASRDAAQLMLPICEAIAFAHERGILHRDLKPSNILLDTYGKPHVSDFGLAKIDDSADSLTETGSVLGTPLYMSPEQAAGRTSLIGPASDIYSLGTVLYHTLTGHPPFRADSPVRLALQILEAEPVPPRKLDARIDRDLEMIVTRCLQKPIDLRYASAADLASDLQAYLSDEPVQARNGRLMQIVTRWFRETHHAVVLEDLGLLWMWHSLVLLITCGLTQALHWAGTTQRLWYAAVWTILLGTWAIVFWLLRRRRGPVTFVERQIAHLWGAALIATTLLTPLEWWLDLPPLTLSPILGIVSGMLFFAKAGFLAGRFYFQSAALFLTSLLMAALPMYAHTIFGFVAALCFFVPGLKYYRQQRARDGVYNQPP